MRRQTKRMAALLLALTLMLTAALPATVLAEKAGEGIVRVLMTRLQLTDRVDVQMDGSYSLEPHGISFQRGSKVVVAISEGAMMLYYEGMALKAEKEIILRRHAIGTMEENGLRVNGGFGLYAGDLHLTVKDGVLRAVLHIPMEEYLLGVVPYEMSNSFPLEALKAQAVSARTYAQRKLGGSQDYDVTDNTNDQVYKGANADNTQAEKAVLETRGVCGYIGRELARCYYTASNGGQTELMRNVWGGSDKELFATRDDPYDLANPFSEVRRFSLPRAVPATGLGNDALQTLVMTALAPQMRGQGYSDEIARIKLTAIDAAEVTTPAYAAPSRVMTKLKLTVRAEGQKRVLAPTKEADDSFDDTATKAPQVTPGAQAQQEVWSDFLPIEQPLTLELNLFPDVEAALNLSINSENNEIITIAESENAFILESRRFGHGVGLSQRGAEQMAAIENWDYGKILQFYYPGIEFRMQTAAATLMPAVDAAFLTTPGPPATPTPRPTLMPVSEQPAQGQWRAVVTQIGQNSTLNLRDQPSTQGGVLQMLYYGQPLLVLEQAEGGWIKVKTDVMEGYVMASFVETEAPQASATPAPPQ